MKRFKLKTFGKINLCLEITGKQKNGYHIIDSIVQEIDLFDELIMAIRHGNNITIKSDNPLVPVDESNLCFKAVKLITKLLNKSFDIEINIKKRIPVGGGMGGGSSNAAGVLKCICKYTGMPVLSKEVKEIALQLGADVPFFLYGNCQRVRGIGESLKPIHHRLNLKFGVVAPWVNVNTKKVYKKYDELKITNAKISKNRSQLLENALLAEDLENIKLNLFNALQRPALALYTSLRTIPDIMKKCGIQKPVMTGSGSCFFGIIEDEKKFQNKSNLVTSNSNLHIFILKPVRRT